MSFLGIEFILFFILVVGVGYALPVKARNVFLLTASYFFYAVGQPAYLVVLICFTGIDYFLALLIGSQESAAVKKRLLICGIVLNLGVLLFFKYFNFFNDFFRAIFTGLKVSYPVPDLDIVLPLGISYYLFKKISYITDVYRGHLVPERSFVRLALYVSFFPEIVAGPIDRARSILPQFIGRSSIDRVRWTEGWQLICWGLFKKLVIADRLGILVDAVYDQPNQYRGAVIALATVFYAFQVYCDFSGYSDMAIGLGRLLGIRLMDNFKQPYLARSIGDFWKRWHISLSTWLRDYLFLPISYALTRRFDKTRLFSLNADRWAYVLAVLFTMLLCGLWHGANWTFVLWGLIHGLLLAVSFITRKPRKKLVKSLGLRKSSPVYKELRIMITFALVSFSWIFFRARSLGEAFTLISRMFSGSVPVKAAAVEGSMIVGLSAANFVTVVSAVVVLVIIEMLLEKRSIHHLLAERPTWLRWAIYYLVIFSILLFGIFEQQEFIYGRF